MKRNYELVVILDSDVKAEDQEKTLAKVKSLISDTKGEVSSSKDWGKKEFTYPINKKMSGNYYLLEFSSEADKITSIKQKLQMEERIIRYLLTNKE